MICMPYATAARKAPCSHVCSEKICWFDSFGLSAAGAGIISRWSSSPVVVKCEEGDEVPPVGQLRV
jgi:hypothetical protein